MRIRLTGSRGYIGTVMAPFLVGAGHEVIGVDTDLYQHSTFGEWSEAITTIEKDVRALEVSDLDGSDAVVHPAALSNDPLGDLSGTSRRTSSSRTSRGPAPGPSVRRRARF